MKKPNPFAKGKKPAKGKAPNPFAKGKPFACGGKVKKYAEGGEVREGQHERIDDGTRADAMKWVAEQAEKPAQPSKPARGAPKPSPKPAPKAKPKAMATPKPAMKAEPKEEMIEDSKPARRVGPTVEAAAEKRKAEMPKGDWYKPVTDQDDEANKYRDRAIGAALGAIPVGAGVGAIGRGVQAASKAGAPIVARAAQWASPAAANKAVSAAREAAPTVAARTKELVMADRVGPKAAEWASRASANKAAAKRAADATKGRTPKTTKGDNIKRKSDFRDDEKGMEFSRGGAVRGTGMARPKKTRFI